LKKVKYGQMFNLLVILHVFVSVFLVGAVLIQSGRGAATANIFGGARAAENVFGASTPSILNRITTILAAMFIITSISLTIFAGNNQRSVIKRSIKTPASAQEFPAPVNPTATVPNPVPANPVPVPGVPAK
jgi:preprotein translocase subunit SecG